MNTKIWQSACGLMQPVLGVAFGGFLLGPFLNEWAGVLLVPCIFALAIWGITGAWYGLLYCLGHLYSPCPSCRRRGKVVRSAKRNLDLACPVCGGVRVTMRPYRTAVVSRIDAENAP